MQISGIDSLIIGLQDTIMNHLANFVSLYQVNVPKLFWDQLE